MSTKFVHKILFVRNQIKEEIGSKLLPMAESQSKGFQNQTIQLMLLF